MTDKVKLDKLYKEMLEEKRIVRGIVMRMCKLTIASKNAATSLTLLLSLKRKNECQR